MRQDLVDDDLEDQRRRQCEDLDEQRRREHMPERLAVAPQRRQEPAQAEHLRADAGPADTTGDEERATVGLPRQVFERQIGRRVGDRIDQPAQARRASPAVDVKRSALQPDDCGGGKLSHPALVDAGRQPGLQPDQFCAANEIELVGIAIAEGKLPMKLHRVGADSVVGGDPAQRAQTAIKRRRFAGQGGRLFHRQALSRVVARPCRRERDGVSSPA